MKIVYVHSGDGLSPNGRVKKAHRHMDVLGQLGYSVFCALEDPNMRPIWFDYTTPIVKTSDVEMRQGDILVFGENAHCVPTVKGSDRCGKVILCDNEYGCLSGLGGNPFTLRKIYQELDAVICASENSEKNLRFMFGASKVLRYQLSFDREPFMYGSDKSKHVVSYCAGVESEIESLFAISSLKWIPEGWALAKFTNRSEKEFANALTNGLIYLSVCKSGYNMSAAEAMASGCVVVGYTGFSNREFMLPGISFPVSNGDVIGLTSTLLDVFSLPIEKMKDIGKKASEFVRSKYSTDGEVRSVKKIWDEIVPSRIEVDDTCDRMSKEVAVYMPVYNEGPYMETLLKWLLPMVGAIYVAESIVPWTKTAKDGGESKSIVDKVAAEMPEFAHKIKYVELKSNTTSDPLIREASQRNEVLEMIQKDGYGFVWLVEADEFYTNSEAKSLWSWFFEKNKQGFVAAHCMMHTYWRSIHYRVNPPEAIRAKVAFRSGCRFSHGRVFRTEDENLSVEVPERVCVMRHYSWARKPADVKNKLAAWGHSKELKDKWFEDVFMAWNPLGQMTNLHPTNPESYKEIVRCTLPLPESMMDHPFVGCDLIEDNHISEEKKRVKVVIMHHNKPENADILYEKLSSAFDDVEIFDNGSDADKIPIHLTRSRKNVYWTGTWNEVLETCSDYDAVWVVGCDIELLSSPHEYRNAIESSLPFGCWSPCIRGRAHPFMLEENFKTKEPLSVVNLEGMALAVSKDFMREVRQLVSGSEIGFGQDFWMCYRSRSVGLKNILDGRVVVFHPSHIGYDVGVAEQQMEKTFSETFGADFRGSIFHYDSRFEYNLLTEGERMQNKKPFTIVTVDNGWGLSEFMRITNKVGESRKIVMRKGVADNIRIPGVEFVPYSPDLNGIIDEADVAFFPRVGVANKEDFEMLLKKGVPIVVREMCANGIIDHKNNGWLFRDDAWAVHWISYLRANPSEIDRVRNQALSKGENQNTEKIVGLKPPVKCKVSVVTPTYKRDIAVINRCVGCMLLQTFKDWEQIICSDGSYEPQVKEYVDSLNDPRIKYCHTTYKKNGDYGHVVRSECLKIIDGEYVFFFDDDNIIVPTFLDEMLNKAAEDEAEVVVCQSIHFGPLNENEVGKPPIILTGDQIKLYHIDPIQFLIKTEVMKESGWDTNYGYISDGVSLEKLSGKKISRINKVLSVHM